MKRAILIGLAFLAGCEQPFDAVNAERFDPPDYYRAWHTEVSQCVGVTAPFGRVRWFGTDRLDWEGEPVSGVWNSPHDIYIARDRIELGEDIQLEATVKHEIIHDLLQEGDHSSEYFTTCPPCGESVTRPDGSRTVIGCGS